MKPEFSVLDHYTTLGTQIVSCNYCQKVLSFNTKSSLEKHFEKEHKEEVLLEEIIEETEEIPQNETNFEPKTQFVEQSCRICLCDLNEIDSVSFEDSLKNFNDVTYLEVFQKITGFDVTENEPQHLCLNCAEKLADSYELRQKCVETQRILDELMSQESHEDVEKVEHEEKPEIMAMMMMVDEIIEEDGDEIEENLEKCKKIDVKDPVFDENTEIFRCSTCGSVYKSIRALRSHYKTSHPSLKTEKCQFCYMTFFPQLVDIHMTHCSRRHNIVQQLCPVCGKAASRSHIYRHIARSKAIDETGRIIEKPFVCDICGARATTKNGIGIHIKALHLNLRIQCDHCDVQVKSRSILAAHMRRFHPEIKKMLKCEHCEFQTASAPSLIRHKAVHFGNRPHKCGICDRRFVTKDQLRVHHATHSDARPHKCEICESPFKTRKALGAHMKTHRAHEYECPVCRKSYLTNQQMRQHVEKNHPEFELPPRGTILNKTWHAKKAEFEMKREMTKVCIEELEETMAIEY